MKWSFILLCNTLLYSATGQTGTTVAGYKHIEFSPSVFFNKFSLNNMPVLTIKSGDTVRTETIDAAGYDKNGVKRQRGGNPLTGPFYIENTKVGDVLAITLTRVSLNRSYAFTTEWLVPRSLPKNMVKQPRKLPIVRWKLDRVNGYASPDSAYPKLINFRVPLTPFLGCIGVAPDSKKNEVLSFFSGPFGGNLDFKRITQQSTVYLPVLHEGAFFYIGDGHAAQGDGELAGNALETSMDVEFTIKVISNPAFKLTYPRVEDSVCIMAVGLGKSLDKALKIATANLLDWLQTSYSLSFREATQVISTTVEYTIAEIADPEVEIVAMIKKARLAGLVSLKKIINPE